MIEGARTVHVLLHYYNVEKKEGGECESIAQSHPSKSSRTRAPARPLFVFRMNRKEKKKKKCAM